MGSSTKKKNEKKKDFQKQKLKVGKTKAKASNFTDTSFKSKAIVLNQQSLSEVAPTANAVYTHHLSLLSSRTDSQRKDSLAYLTTQIVSRPVNAPLPQPVSVVLPKLLPLILDGNSGVRTGLLKLLKSFPSSDIDDQVATLLPYVRAGMTHLAADIRLSSVEIMAWLIETAGHEVVSCAGGWVKTMNCFLSLLGWHTAISSKWSTTRPAFGKSGSEGKPMARVLQVFAEFLRAGLVEAVVDEHDDGEVSLFPLWQSNEHRIPSRSNAYAYLNLFGSVRDEETEMYESREDRVRVFTKLFRTAVDKGLSTARQEGGEVGRASAIITKILKEIRDEDSDSDSD